MKPPVNSTTFTLADRLDSYNFHVGVPMRSSDGVRWRRENWRDRLLDRARRYTRWFRPRTVTSAVDAEAGTITLVDQRWSWLKWKWL